MSSLNNAYHRYVLGHTGTPPNPPDPPPPEPPPPVPMPDPDDPLLLAKKRRSITATYKARGRASTILSDVTTDPLGGQ